MDAAAPPDSLKTYFLHPIRVIADRSESAVSMVQSIPAAESGGRNAFDLHHLLTGTPGLSSTLGTKDESTLRIRGFYRSDIQILVDGRPLSKGYFGNVDLSKLALSGIDQIIIIKGPNSALYGSGAMGGVVNLITKAPAQDSWFGLKTSFKRNNNNLIELSSSHEFQDIGYTISVSRQNSEGLVLSRAFENTPFENGGVRNHSGYTAYNSSAKLDLKLPNFTDVGLSFDFRYIPNKQVASSIHIPDYRVFRDWHRASASLAMQKIISEASTFSSSVYYDRAGDTFDRYRDAAHTSLDLSSIMRSYTLGLNPQLQLQHRNSNITMGLRSEFKHVTRKDTGGYQDWTPNWVLTNSLFSQLESKLNEVLGFTGSISVSGYHSSLNSKLRFFYEPAAGIYYDHPAWGKTSLSMGLNTAMPTMRQLFSSDSGNPNLKNAHALKTELGNQRNWGTPWALGTIASLFYNRGRNIIDLNNQVYTNIYKMDSYGLELSIIGKPAQWWQSGVDYALIGYDSDYVLSETPAHKLSFSNHFMLPFQINLSLVSRWQDVCKSADDAGVFHVLPAYHNHDLSLSRKWGKFNLSMGIENILDANYLSEYGFPAAGRDFFFSMGLDL